MPPKKKDARIERTREALTGAFVALMLGGKRYDRITIGDVIARAGVGRSTFYEHYRNKDEILAETVRHPFAMLAGAVDRDDDASRLRAVLAHFRDNRVHGRTIFGGSARRAMVRVLASMIEDRLLVRSRMNGVAPSSTLAIVSVALAEGQLGAIVGWLGESEQEIAPLADALHRIAQATARDVCGG